MIVEVYKVVVDVVHKRPLRLKRKRDSQATRKWLYKSPMFVSIVKDLKMGDLPSFAADPF